MNENLIGLGEVLASKEAAGGEGRGMGSFEDVVARGVNEGFLFMGEFPPEEEDEAGAMFRKLLDNTVGEILPSDFAVRGGIARPHC